MVYPYSTSADILLCQVDLDAHAAPSAPRSADQDMSHPHSASGAAIEASSNRAEHLAGGHGEVLPLLRIHPP